jgi:uncharacterized membrane protein YbaN (DUF454 family)
VPAGLLKVILIICGTLFVALGVVGIFLPLVPTTVFLLLAAACYARSSSRLYAGLLGNRWLGSYIRNYHERRGMRRRDRVVTLSMLWVGISATLIWTVHTLWLGLLLLGIAVGVTIHVVRLPGLKQPEFHEPLEEEETGLL